MLTVLYFLLPFLAAGQQKFAYLSCHLHSLNNGDTLTLVSDKYGRPYFPGTRQEYVQVIHQGNANFKIAVDGPPIRFNIGFNGNQHLQDMHGFIELRTGGTYYLEAGDHIVLTEQDGNLSFSGKGAAKYQIREAFEKIDDEIYVPVNRDSKKEDYQRFITRQDSGYRAKLAILKQARRSVSPVISQLFRADVTGLYLDMRSLKKLTAGLKYGVDYNSPSFMAAKSDTAFFNHYPLSAYSPFYAGGLITNYRFVNYCCLDKPFDLLTAYHYFKMRYSGVLRDRLVAHLIYENKKSEEDLGWMAEDALTYVGTADLRRALAVVIANHKIGKPAYNFALSDTTGKVYRLSDFKDKVVLLDYWYNGCGGCRLVGPYLARIEKLFEGKPVEFISITFQKGEQWKKGIRSGDYMSAGVLNLSTEGGKVTEHPALTSFDVTEFPTLIMIDKTGKLLRNPIDPRLDGGKDLTGLINEALK
jgi:thiol-disulfide isomerase/thioredoxin